MKSVLGTILSIVVLLAVFGIKGYYSQQRQMRYKTMMGHDTKISETSKNVNEYINSTCDYRTKNENKAHGLDITISYPCVWQIIDNDMPNMVKLFTEQNEGGAMLAISLSVRQVGNIASEEQIKEAVQPQKLKELGESVGEYISGERMKVNGIDGLEVVVKNKNKIDNGYVYTYKVCDQLFYARYVIDITYTVGSIDFNKATEKFKEKRGVFKWIFRTIVYHLFQWIVYHSFQSKVYQ